MKPQGQESSPHLRAVGPTQSSIPKVPLITLDAILGEKEPVLVLKRVNKVVLFLVVDVPNEILKIGKSHRECAVSALPREGGQPRELSLHPFRRRCLECFHKTGNRSSPAKPNGEMNMISSTAYSIALTIGVPNYRRQVSVHDWADRRLDCEFAIFGAEDYLD